MSNYEATVQKQTSDLKSGDDETLSIVSTVDSPGISALVEVYFREGKIIVGRLGQVWAAFWRASSLEATKKIYEIKGRQSNKPFSVLGPVELLQSLVDLSRVSENYVPLLLRPELLVKAIGDKLFLRFPISVDKKEELGIPDSVVSFHENEGLGDPYYAMQLISGPDAGDYRGVQDAMAPADLVSGDIEGLRSYIDHHLVAITSWNYSGQGSNYDDFEEAKKLCEGHGIPLMIKQAASRGRAHGSYGILDMIAQESMAKGQSKVVRRAELADNYWRDIVRNFVEQARMARSLNGGKQPPLPDIDHSGF